MTPAPAPRSQAIGLLVVGSLAVAVLLVVLVPWNWTPGATRVTVPVADVFTPDEVARAEAYVGPQRWLGWSSLAVSLAVSSLLGFTMWGRRVASRLKGPWWTRVVVLVGLVLAIGSLSTLPLRMIARTRAMDAGLSTATWWAWGRDQMVDFGVGWVSTALVILAVLLCARLSPRWWPTWLAALGVAMVFVGSLVWPVVVEPLFNKFHSMPQGELRAEILSMAKRDGVRVDDVLVADASRRTTTLNAYVSGLGTTRRVVVYDTLLERAPREEVLLVVAHELGHARDHDVAVGTALASGGAVVGVGLLALILRSPGVRRRHGAASEVSVVPYVLALSAVATLLISPLPSAVSRAMEARADRTSLELTRDPAAFEALHHRLAVSSLSDPTPPAWSQWWFGSHPTALQRIGIARTLERQGNQ